MELGTHPDVLDVSSMEVVAPDKQGREWSIDVKQIIHAILHRKSLP